MAAIALDAVTSGAGLTTSALDIYPKVIVDIEAVSLGVASMSGMGATWVGAPVGVTYSAQYSTGLAVNAWDHDPNTSWNTNSTSPAWAVADFGTPVSASRIWAGSASVARTWVLSGSNDNTNWTTLLSNFNAPVGAAVYYDLPGLYTFRYWKVYASSGAWTDPHTFRLEATAYFGSPNVNVKMAAGGTVQGAAAPTGAVDVYPKVIVPIQALVQGQGSVVGGLPEVIAKGVAIASGTMGGEWMVAGSSKGRAVAGATGEWASTIPIAGVSRGVATVVAPNVKVALGVAATSPEGGATVSLETRPGLKVVPTGIAPTSVVGDSARGISVFPMDPDTPRTILTFAPGMDERSHPVGIASTAYVGRLTIRSDLGAGGALGDATAFAELSVTIGLNSIVTAAAVTESHLSAELALGAVSTGAGSASAKIGTILFGDVVGSSTVAGDMFRAIIMPTPIAGAADVTGVTEAPGFSAAVTPSSAVTGHATWQGHLPAGSADGQASVTPLLGLLKPLPSAEAAHGDSMVTASGLRVTRLAGNPAGAGVVTARSHYLAGVKLKGAAVGAAVNSGSLKRTRNLNASAANGTSTTWGHIYKAPDDIFPDPIAGAAAVTAFVVAELRATAAGLSVVDVRIASDGRIGIGTAVGTSAVAGTAERIDGGWPMGRSTITGILSRHRHLTGGTANGVATVPGRSLSWMAFRGKPQGVTTFNSVFLQEVTRGVSVGLADLVADLSELVDDGLHPSGIYASSVAANADLLVHTFTTLKVLGWVTAVGPGSAQMATWVQAGSILGQVPRYGEYDATGRYVSITTVDRPIRRQETYRV